MTQTLSSVQNLTREQTIAAAEKIHRTAEAENRNLTRAEQIAFNACIARMKDLAVPSPAIVGGQLQGGRTSKGGLLLRPQDSVQVAMAHRIPNDSPDPADLSFDRWVYGAVTGRWGQVPAEHAANIKAMTESSGPGGGYLLPPSLGFRLLDAVRAASACVQLGAVSQMMETPEMPLARQDSDPTASWHSEGVRDITATDIDVSLITLRSKTVAAMTRMSVELFEDAPLAGDMVMTSIAAALALELDAKVIDGQRTAGPNEPLGLVRYPGVTSTALSVAITMDALIDSIYRILAQNHRPTGLLWPVAVAKTFVQITDGEGQYYGEADLPEDLRGLTRLASTQCPASTVVVGDWSKLVIGLRTDSAVIESTRVGSGSSSNDWESLSMSVRGYLRGDSAVTYPRAFDVMTAVS